VALRVIGPPGTQRVVDGVLAMLDLDVRYRIDHHATLDDPPSVVVTEVEPGEVLEVADATVTVYETDHRPVAPTVGYRVEHAGSTARSGWADRRWRRRCCRCWALRV
jgi:ribonuclease Z